MKIMKILVFAAGVAAFASGGVVINVQIQPLTEKSPATSQQLWVEKDRIRMSLQTSSQENHYMIYRQDQNAVFVINPAEKSYLEMTRDEMNREGSRIKQAMEQMKEAMKNMPPDQRAAMEKMIHQRGMTEDTAAPMEFKKVGPAKVGSWNTTEYEGYRSGLKTVRTWITPFATFGLKPDDFAVMKSIGDFYRGMHAGPSQDFFQLSQQLGGWPVRTEVLDDSGNVQVRVEVQNVKKQSIAPSEFEVPAGFTKQQMQMPGSKEGNDPSDDGSH